MTKIDDDDGEQHNVMNDNNDDGFRSQKSHIN